MSNLQTPRASQIKSALTNSNVPFAVTAKRKLVTSGARIVTTAEKVAVLAEVKPGYDTPQIEAKARIEILHRAATALAKQGLKFTASYDEFALIVEAAA